MIFKAKEVLEALRGEETINELAKQYQVHPLMITKWKKHAVSLLPTLFYRKGGKVKAGSVINLVRICNQNARRRASELAFKSRPNRKVQNILK